MTDKKTDKESKADPDPLAVFILSQLGSGGDVSHQDIARAYAETRRKAKDPPDLWRRYMNAVKQQVLHLAREGQVEIVRGGKVVDVEDFRGLVKLRLSKKRP